MIRWALVLLAVVLVSCASQSPAPEPSALRREAQAATEAGRARFAGRHFASAARSFGRAAEIFGALDDPGSEAVARRNQAEALRRAGDLASAAAGFQRALALDRSGDRAEAQARDLSGLARCSSTQGDYARAIGESERALALVGDEDALRAALEIDLAVYLLARGDEADRERVVALLTSAAGLARTVGEPRTRAAADLHLGRAQLEFGAPDLARQALARALEGFRALDDPEGLARTHEGLGRLRQRQGDPTAARRHFEQARLGYEFLGDAAALASIDALLDEGRE